MVKIKNRYTGKVICSGETVKAAVELAIKSGADLTRANLTGANLTGGNLYGADLTVADLTGADLTRANLYRADLTGANLTGGNLYVADLTRADLTRANLHGADLTGANLTWANLTRANLSGANLTGANLYGADLHGANLNWKSHDLIAEVLRQAAGDNVPRRKIAGLILVSRDWCWEDFFDLDDPERGWVIGVLRGYVRDGDELPNKFKKAIEGLITSQEAKHG